MTLSAMLLAGGESRRMGSDKATLEWRGRFLWERQIEKLRALRPERIFVSARSEVSWRPADAELIVDLAPSRGPLSGLAPALAAIATHHLVVLAVDMPLMPVEHLRELCVWATPGRGVVPSIAGRAEPLCAIYPREAGAIFEEALQGKTFSLQPIIRKLIALNMLREVTIAESSWGFYRNINKPGDLA